MKRTGTLIMIFCIIISSMTSVFGASSQRVFPDVIGRDCEKSVRELEILNIMQGYQDGTFRPDNILTRAEFSILIARILGMESLADSMKNENIFVDVPSEHWAAGYINFAYQWEIINGYDDDFFGPEDEVTLEQACKMVLECMGYGFVAAEKGGYPIGYIAVASQSGILKKVRATGTEALTRGEAAKMLAEAMDVPLIEKDYNKDIYIKSNDKTLRTNLCNQLDIEKKEGIVSANAYTSFDGGTDVGDGRIKIDGEVYRAELENVNHLLGYYVEYYAASSSSGGDSIYSIIVSTRKNNEVSFYARDIEAVSDNEFDVYYETSKKEKRYMLETPVKTVYNGKYLPNAGKNDWKIKNGRVRLLDNNGDEKYDIVFIEEFQSYLVGSVDNLNQSLTLNTFSAKASNVLWGKNSISLMDIDKDILITNLEGENLDFSDIKPMQMIDVMESKDGEFITIIPAGEPFSGTVESVSSDDATVTIDGEKYYISKNISGENIVEFKPGDKGKFWPDSLGKIAAKDVVSYSGYGQEVETVNKDLICSYILLADIDTGVSTIVTLKLLTNLIDGTREERVFEVAERVIVNDTRIDAENLLDTIKNVNGGDYHIPITYTLNGKGKINKINMFTQTVPMGYMTYSSAKSAFDGLYYINDNTVTYFVDNRNYDIVYEKSDVELSNSTRYQVRIFDPVGEAFSVKKRIFVIYMDLENVGGTNIDLNKPLLVKTMVSYYDDGMVRNMIEGLVNGKTINEKLKEGLKNKVDKLKFGTLISYSKNGIGEIKDIKIIAQMLPIQSYRRGIGGTNEQIYGKVENVERNSDYSSCVVTISYSQNSGTGSAAYEIANIPVYLVNSKTASVIETGEIGVGDNIFLNVVNFEVKAIIIVR